MSRRGFAVLSAALSAALLGGCSTAPANPPGSSPSVAGSGAGLHCRADDHGLNEPQVGWGFCYPSNWRFHERVAASSRPRGVDTTLDVVAEGGADNGLFGFLIIGSYDRGGAADLASWLAANEPGDTDVTRITWGNAADAVKVNGQLRRYALTANRVYTLVEREGTDNLNLEAALSPRLQDWKFTI